MKRGSLSGFEADDSGDFCTLLAAPEFCRAGCQDGLQTSFRDFEAGACRGNRLWVRTVTALPHAEES